MSTNKPSKPIGKGTRNLTTNVPNELYAGVVIHAGVSGCKIGEYVRAILENAVAEKIIVRENEEDKMRYLDAIQNGERPLPKVRLEVVKPDSPKHATAHPPSRQASRRTA